MSRSQSRLLAVTAIAGLTALLGACAQPAPESTTAPEPPHSATTPAATTSPTPSAVPTGAAGTAPGAPGSATPHEGAALELVDFETQNGTMRIRVPASWTATDTSEPSVDYEGQWRWDNQVTFTTGDGSTLWYWDGAPDNVGAALEQHVVEQVAMDSGLAATAWWDRSDDDTYYASVAVVSDEAPHSDSFMVDGSTRLHFLTYGPGEDERRFTSREAAEAYLQSDAVALALDVMATVQITAAGEVMPEDAGVQHEGTTYLPYTTRNGTATFLVPREWTVRDTSSVGTNRAGQQVWNNSVTLEWLPVGPMLHYGDMEFTNIIEEWEWTLGEVRATRTDGWQAVSWALGDSVPNNAGRVGVSLTDQEGAVRPADTVCSERMCRSFASLPTPAHWYREAGVDGPEDFFGSAMEERLLTVVASLETHHDDPTRMP